MSFRILISKRIYPEAVECLRGRAEIEYCGPEESCSFGKLLEHLTDKDGVISQLTDHFSDEVMAV